MERTGRRHPRADGVRYDWQRLLCEVLHADIFNLRRLAVITSAFHMPRACRFRSHLQVARHRRRRRPRLRALVPRDGDAMLPPRVIAARRAKEAAAVPRYSPGSDWALRLRDMRAPPLALLGAHGYAAGRLEDPATPPLSTNPGWSRIGSDAQDGSTVYHTRSLVHPTDGRR